MTIGKEIENSKIERYLLAGLYYTGSLQLYPIMTFHELPSPVSNRTPELGDVGGGTDGVEGHKSGVIGQLYEPQSPDARIETLAEKANLAGQEAQQQGIMLASPTDKPEANSRATLYSITVIDEKGIKREVLPISGGGPSHQTESRVEGEDPSFDEAKTYIRANLFERKWNRRKQEKEHNRMHSEVTRLNTLYPGIVDEVYLEKKIEIRKKQNKQ